MVNRLGRVDDGTSVTDYDEEEIQRKFTISAALAYAEWGKTKINFIDTPGYNIFLHEALSALAAADATGGRAWSVRGGSADRENVGLLRTIRLASRAGGQSNGPRALQPGAHPGVIAHLFRQVGDSGAASHRRRKKLSRSHRPGQHEGIPLRT